MGVRVSALRPGNLLRSGPLRPEPEEPEAGAGCERGQVTPVRVDTQSGEVMVHQVRYGIQRQMGYRGRDQRSQMTCIPKERF